MSKLHYLQREVKILRTALMLSPMDDNEWFEISELTDQWCLSCKEENGDNVLYPQYNPAFKALAYAIAEYIVEAKDN